MTFWRFFTTRYTDHLESQVADLKSQLAQERQDVRRLTEALVPALQRRTFEQTSLRSISGSGAIGIGDAAVTQRPHHITKAGDQQSASCTCGWKAESDDPVEMQTAISEHYKVAFPPTKAKRPTMSERIRAEEEKSFKESQAKRTSA